MLSTVLNFASCNDHEIAQGRGLELEGIEALQSQPQDAASSAEVVEAFTTAAYAVLALAQSRLRESMLTSS